MSNKSNSNLSPWNTLLVRGPAELVAASQVAVAFELDQSNVDDYVAPCHALNDIGHWASDGQTSITQLPMRLLVALAFGQWRAFGQLQRHLLLRDDNAAEINAMLDRLDLGQRRAICYFLSVAHDQDSLSQSESLTASDAGLQFWHTVAYDETQTSQEAWCTAAAGLKRAIYSAFAVATADVPSIADILREAFWIKRGVYANTLGEAVDSTVIYRLTNALLVSEISREAATYVPAILVAGLDEGGRDLASAFVTFLNADSLSPFWSWRQHWNSLQRKLMEIWLEFIAAEPEPAICSVELELARFHLRYSGSREHVYDWRALLGRQ
jgi:hypothetical protein